MNTPPFIDSGVFVYAKMITQHKTPELDMRIIFLIPEFCLEVQFAIHHRQFNKVLQPTQVRIHTMI